MSIQEDGVVVAHRVADWLRGLGNSMMVKDDIRPIKIEINGETFYGAIYGHLEPPTEKCPESKHEYRMYLVGDLPKGYMKSDKFCYVIPEGAGDFFQAGDWYVAGFLNQKWKKKHRQPETTADILQKYHPFGDNFGLHRWSTPDGTLIDTCEDKPYTRRPLSVEYV